MQEQLSRLLALSGIDLPLLLATLSALSLLTLLISLLALPWLVSKLPVDFFRTYAAPKPETVAARLRHYCRNFAATLLLIAGIAMLVMPGQGLLCIFLALALGDLPGKHRMMQALIAMPALENLLNWIREKRGKPPFEFD